MGMHRMLNSKLHRARVTGAELDYIGSVSIDSDLLERAGIAVNEMVAVWNLATGDRFETYAIAGGDGEVCLNGAAARLAQPGDLVIIATFVDLTSEQLTHHCPTVVVLDEGNRPTEAKAS